MKEHDSLYSWFRLIIALLVATVGNIGMWVVVIVLPDIQQEFAIDRSTASIPFALTMVGFAIGNGVMGRVVDRYGITKTIILAKTPKTQKPGGPRGFAVVRSCLRSPALKSKALAVDYDTT